MNVERLKRVREQILAEPARFDMNDYVSPVYDERQERCGTALCMAGFAALDAGFIVLRDAPRDGTARVYYDTTTAGAAYATGTKMFAAALDIDGDQAQALFHHSGWPGAFYKAFRDAETSLARARVAAARIDAFIASGGRS